MHRRTGMVALLVALTMVASACGGGSPARGGEPRRGGTLRLLAARDVASLDTGATADRMAWTLMRAYARQLYAFDGRARGDRAALPVPDLALSSSVSDGGRTWTFHLRQGARFGPPVDREIVAADFVTAVERQLRPAPSSNPYLGLIKGAQAYAAGRADRVEGIEVVGARGLRFHLTRPAPDFLSIVALPWFAPVPAEHARRYQRGDAYSRHVVASGPYQVAGHQPGRSLTLVRNPSWDAASDPLRSAWVDRIEVDLDTRQVPGQRAIERGDADLRIDGIPPPHADLVRLSHDDELSRRFSVQTTGCLRYLALRTDHGPTRKLAVRQALNYAVDKDAVLRALGGAYAGEATGRVLPRSLPGFQQDERYPSTDSRGDVDRARRLLAQGGWPEGVVLTAAGGEHGNRDAAFAAVRRSLARAGIELTETPPTVIPAVALTRACPDYPGRWSPRALLGPVFGSRHLGPPLPSHPPGYRDRSIDRTIDAALTEPDPDQRATLWASIDDRIMHDAPIVPLVSGKRADFWSTRVHNWTWSPWIANPDLTNLWLEA